MAITMGQYTFTNEELLATSQKTLVIAHLKANKTLTQVEAMRLYGITDLATQIKILRRNGYKISTNYKSGTNRFGKKTRYGVYELQD